MLLIIVLVLLTGIGILLMWHSGETAYDIEAIAGGSIAFLAAIALFVVVIIALIQNLNDNDLGKKELYDQITQYNSRVASGKAMQRDPWVGVLFPNIYDNFELIPLE